MRHQEVLNLNNPERPITTQRAVRFTPIPGIESIPLDSRLLQVDTILAFSQTLAKRLPLAKYDGDAPKPDAKTLEALGMEVLPIEAARVCGTDKALVNLDLALSNLAFAPDTSNQSTLLKLQDTLVRSLAKYSQPALSHPGKALHSWTLGHEILVPGHAVYPLFSDKAVNQPLCTQCQAGNQNHCQRFWQSRADSGQIRGFALGFGAIAVDEQGRTISELGGGFAEFIAVNPEFQLIPHQLPLAKAASIDNRACVKQGLEKVIGPNHLIQPNTPAVIIGFGNMGLNTADELSQLGWEMHNVAVIAKYHVQEKAAEDLGCVSLQS